jgi:hypothetical protein
MDPRKLVIDVIKRYPSVYLFLRHTIYARVRSLHRERIFRNIYERNLWDGTWSTSGPGSTMSSTADIRSVLPNVVRKLQVRSLLDIPCGDFLWMKDVDLGVETYIGADIVSSLVTRNQQLFGNGREFIVLDLLRDSLPHADMVFCRDCLVHLSFREIHLALENIKASAPRFIAMTTFPGQPKNIETVIPYWRALNMQLPPFGFPEPIELIKDFSEVQKNDQGKYLGIWSIDKL